MFSLPNKNIYGQIPNLNAYFLNSIDVRLTFIFDCFITAAAYTSTSYANMQTMYQKKMFHRFSRKRSQKSIKFALPRAMFHFLLSEFLLCTNFYFFLYRIGIRSQDLQDLFERTVKGSGIALSSPRLVILAAIYGLWELSQHFGHDIFDFQVI